MGLACHVRGRADPTLRSHAVTSLDSDSRSPARAAAYVHTPSGTYAVLVALFCGLLLISNVAATKLITVVDGLPAYLGGGIFADGGALLFPLTYILGDVLAEVYGDRKSTRLNSSHANISYAVFCLK